MKRSAHMNAAELIEYIRTAEKKTPVKVYIWERFPTSFPNAKVFPAGDGAKIVFGDWRDIGPAIEAQQDAIADIVIESSCRNSAVPLLWRFQYPWLLRRSQRYRRPYRPLQRGRALDVPFAEDAGRGVSCAGRGTFRPDDRISRSAA